jgi:hypothetical protein
MKMRFLKNIVLCFVLFAAYGVWAQELKEVTAAGSAEGTPDKAGELALARALRDAVQQGAGVDVMSESKVSNFQMEYDRVITSSFGYIKDYKIISRSYSEKDKIYSVTVKAQVGKGSPGMDQALALRLLVRRMQSPRLTIQVKEKISGEYNSEMPVSQAALEEIAQKTGLEVFKQNVIQERDEKESDRAALLGDNLESKVKKAGITSSSDFKITANVNGSVGKLKEPFPDVQVRDASIGVNMQAVWTDTGEVISTVNIPTLFFHGEGKMSLPYEMPDQLMRYYLMEILTGKVKSAEQENAYSLFRKILAKWVVELDLGAKVQLEFRQIDKEAFDKLIETLRGNPDISYAWRREFDSRLYSIIEIETRLDAAKIEDVVLAEVGRKFKIDAATKRRLRFIPK